MSREPRDAQQFYLTSRSACPYLPGREERKVFTHLIGRRAPSINDTLTQSGFRRSQTIAYRPACEACQACVSVRVKAAEFRPSRGFRRVLTQNAQISALEVANKATPELYGLFRAYLDSRHADGGMADMSALDFSMMIEDSHVQTSVTQYRLDDGSLRGKLVAACLTDHLVDGLSMVYSFYDPEYTERSLGTLMILDHIFTAQRRSLPHVYLGYWIEGSRKMAYKARFLPQERLGMDGWQRVG